MFIYKYVKTVSRLQQNHCRFSQFYKNNPTISHGYYYNNKSFKLGSAHRIVNFCSISDNNRKISEAFSNLDSSYKQQIRINKSDIVLLTKSIENEDILNEGNYILLFHCCGHLIPDEFPSSRMALAEKAWQILLKKKVNLTVEHYNSLLRCYIENRKIFSHKEFLASMICEPNHQTFNLLLESISENGDMEQAVNIVNIMKDKGIGVNETVFTSLILCHLRCGDVKSAQNILDTMRIAQIKPSSNTYAALLRGYAECNNLEQFKSTLKHAANREFSVKQIVSILHSVSLSENLELLPLIKEAWASRIDTRTFGSKLTNLCIHLIYLNKPLTAHELYKCFIDPDMGFVSVSDTYESVLLYEMIRLNTPSDTIIKIVNDLIQTERNIYAMFKATEFALKIPDIKLSLVLLTAMHQRKTELRNHYFWPILVREAKENGEKGIFEIFYKMCECNVKIDSDTLDTYSLQYIKNLDADIMLNRLKQFNLSLTESITPISFVLLQQGKIKEVVELTSKYNLKLNARSNIIKVLCSAFISSGDVTNTIAVLKNIVIKDEADCDDFKGQLLSMVIVRSGTSNNQYILNLLRAYKTEGIKISVNSMDKIVYLLRKFDDSNIKNKMQNIVNSLEASNNDEVNNHIPHPRNMSLKELECHLIELREKNMETRGLLRKLINQHCKSGNVQRVTELCHDFEKAGYNMTAGMKSNLLDLYIKNNNLEKAWETYKTIKKTFSSFTVDEFKIIDLAKVLYEHKMFDEVIKLLRNESSNRKILGGANIEANCWRLLNAVSKTGNTKETKSMLKTLIDGGFCTPSNVMLGPLVRVHMSSDNISETVEEYVNCCVKYKKTPLMHELLCHVLKKQASPELIKKVIEATAFVHSASKAETALVAALAETGLVKPLRKLLVELSNHLNNALLNQFCERWVKENKIEAMKNIIASAEGLTIDLSDVYLGLMRSYYANNDCDNALSLWNDMQERHILPNERIKEMIDTLLLNNKLAKNKQL